jgi:uncharacterized membrane protein YebE (DUF533 family)
MGGGRQVHERCAGGGVMALLGAMAFKALKSSGNRSPQVPLGLAEPQTESERQQLEQNAELVLRAMINAAKADGRIDEDEIRRIVGKLGEVEKTALGLGHYAWTGQAVLANDVRLFAQAEPSVARC